MKDLQSIKLLEKGMEKTSEKRAHNFNETKSQEIRTNIKENNTEEIVIDGEFNCMECPYQGTQESELNKHVELKHRIKCRNCEKMFETKKGLMVHRKQEHYSTVAECRKGKECDFADRCWWKHSEVNENMIECYFCDLTFGTKGEVMMHRKKQHAKTVKNCIKFENKNCNNSEANCWFKHETFQSENKKSEQSNPNNLVFQKRQNILRSP